MATLGLVNYLNLTLQFSCATMIFDEPINGMQFFSFSMIWLALALYLLKGFRKEEGYVNVFKNHHGRAGYKSDGTILYDSLGMSQQTCGLGLGAAQAHLKFLSGPSVPP